jgi:hypothetical protein
VDLEGRDLTAANFSEADLTEARLSDYKLEGANFSSANLGAAILEGADLTEANLSGTDLTRTNLRNTTLSAAPMFRADINMADFRNARLYPAHAASASRNLPQELTGCAGHAHSRRASFGLAAANPITEIWTTWWPATTTSPVPIRAAKAAPILSGSMAH